MPSRSLSLSKGPATTDAVGEINAVPYASSANEHAPMISRSGPIVRLQWNKPLGEAKNAFYGRRGTL